MMMPSILGENLFDDFMNDFRLPAFPDVDKELYGKHAKNLIIPQWKYNFSFLPLVLLPLSEH